MLRNNKQSFDFVPDIVIVFLMGANDTLGSIVDSVTAWRNSFIYTRVTGATNIVISGHSSTGHTASVFNYMQFSNRTLTWYENDSSLGECQANRQNGDYRYLAM